EVFINRHDTPPKKQKAVSSRQKAEKYNAAPTAFAAYCLLPSLTSPVPCCSPAHRLEASVLRLRRVGRLCRLAGRARRGCSRCARCAAARARLPCAGGG